MNRLFRSTALVVAVLLLLLALPWASAAAAEPGQLRVTGQSGATVGELATVTITLPANVAAFDGRLLVADGAAEVIGVAPVGKGIGLRPEVTGDGTAIAAYGLKPRDGATTVRIAVNPLVEGRVEMRLVIDAAADAAGRRIDLADTNGLATISAGDGKRMFAAPAARRTMKPTGKAVKPRDLRPDRVFSAQDVDTARAAWTRAHADAGAICDGSPDGDANRDGCVDIVDLQLLHSVKGQAVTSANSSDPVAALPALQTTAPRGASIQSAESDSFVPVRTFTVTSPADTEDAAPGNGICADSNGNCTLRAAIIEADYMQGQDRIAFNLPGTAPVTIQTTGKLLMITARTGGVFIDGYSQPGASPNTAQYGSNAVPGVFLRGNGTAAREYGIFITSGGNIVRGLAFGNYWRAVMLDGVNATSNQILGNWIGFTGAGANNGGSIGVLVNVGAHDNVIGSPALADRNVIGNYSAGVDAYGPGSDGTVIQNNQFCISPSGGRAPCSCGIDHNFGPKRELIGGTDPNMKNVLGPTYLQGIELSHGYNPAVPAGTDFSLPYLINDHRIIGNWVGFRMDGTYDPLYRSGLNFSSADNAQGINVYDGVYNNLVLGNYVASVYDGITLRSPNASENVFRQNIIGIAPNGGGAAPLTGWGFKVGWSATHNLVENNTIVNAASGGIGMVNTANTGVPQAPAYNIKLSRNLISNTSGPAIDLFGIAGPDPNDPGDADEGANALLNTPVITSISTGSVSGTGQPTATVEVYLVSRAPGAYGLPQGYLGSAVVGGNGTWSLATPLTPTSVAGAIQIMPDWNTSEFGPNVGFTAPTITSSNSTTFSAGSPNAFTITTTGNPVPSIAKTGGLPAGVTFTDNGNGTATLAGVPDVGSQGAYPLTITAANGVNPDATQAFTLTVLAAVLAAPAITSPNSATFTAGTAGSFTVTTTGTPVPSIAETGGLPAGVTFTDNGNGTATLAGTPGVGSQGAYPLSITAANGVNPDATQAFTLTVLAAPAITSPNSATFTAGTAGSFTVTTTGTPVPSIAETGGLPAGVTFTDNGNGTATLAGTPGVGSQGAYPLTITAANGVNPDATQAFTLTVLAAPAITSPNSATFTAGTAGSFTVTTTGTPVPSIAETGGLPAGVTFTDNGNGTATLAGTPGVGSQGAYPLTITAANGVNPDATQAFTLTVTPLTTYATDTFTRTVKGGWGTADFGGSWTVSTTSAFNVNGSVGTVSAAKTQTRAARLGTVSARDLDMRTTIGLATVPKGGSVYEYLVARRVSTNTEYRAKIRIAPGGAVYAQVLTAVSGTETAIGSEVLVSGVTVTPSSPITVRLRVTGVSPTTLQLKVWPSSAAEPGTWAVSRTNTTTVLQAAGSIGIRSYVASNVTNGPIVTRFDDLSVLVP